MEASRQAQQLLSSEEIEILQEVMNIAFGSASGELAEIIDVQVILSVPNIRLLPAQELYAGLSSELGDEKFSVIEQHFSGNFTGVALLNFPAGTEQELLYLFCHENEVAAPNGDLDTLTRETLLEVGNILIGACVGKLVELLQEVVAYSPPQLIMRNFSYQQAAENLFNPEDVAISITTQFSFDQRNVQGSLFLITSEESVAWLKQALQEFLEQFLG